MTGQLQICIHRGTREIGGSCVELEYDGKRIVVDLGLPLNAELEATELPHIPAIHSADGSLLGVLLSHGHRDHWGLLPKLPGGINVHLGRKTLSIMTAAAPFMPGGYAPDSAMVYEDQKAFELGPFWITPHLMDHSGFDAYGFLIEAGGRRIYYSGDIRGHGRKAALFERFLASPPADVDLLLMEGSSLGRLSTSQRFETENEIENRLLETMRRTAGIVLVACSAQNIDRVVSVYRAAKRSGRRLLVDAYAAEVLKATDTKSIPKPTDEWPDVKVYIPQAQRRFLKERNIAALVDAYKGRRVFPEALPEEAAKSAMLMRPWMLRDLAQAGALMGASAIWSQWDGYLKEEAGIKFQDACRAASVGFEIIHTSGHADPHDLQRFAEAMQAKKLVPIHTFQPDQFEGLFGNVARVVDGEWFYV
ncbi:MBL fold metallo-hydrolase [Rhizobium sp. PRIMUS64]|uniref:MBL fold metallo-hydrolase n=1 Tax=Rhizobium sp. PRIMUS64 TaxID=2908925 RepID=UPI001FF2F6A6|nr:MBL fold metallo-hydrolase [Rhizobium sp. PRIMUS64]MCJ9691383.1 MBL fold metallo-hydrolase [Rhizobium sp. PRIMUS64]